MLLLHVCSGEFIWRVLFSMLIHSISQNPFLLSRYSRIIDLVIFVFEIEQFKMVEYVTTN